MSDKPARVLHVITTLPVGGAERVILNTVSLLDPTRFESVVCCIMQEGELAEEVRQRGVKVVSLDLMSSGGWDSKVVPALTQLIREEAIDLVHSHLYHANLYGRIAAYRCGIPSVVTIHNTYVRTKWHRRLLNWYWGRRTAALIAVSDDIKRDVVRWDHVPESLVQVIPNGISIERVQSILSVAEARERLDIDAGTPVLVAVGRLEEQKGHKYLLSALPELAQKGYRPVCLIVGEGRERASLTAQAEALGVASQVRLMGTRSDVSDILRAADVFVMPSLWEGLSLALLDAMAAKKPIVATDVGGMRQVLGDRLGLLVPSADASALADALMFALTRQEEMHRMSEAAYARVCDEFSDRRMVGDVASLYHRVLGSRT
ncbi:glycosyltransferase [Mangrovitalea sediminis]|uniref:glycosyltransferase n=1 Tax=Mangrovitalea sediminis TaxID=1982043 RepID=UPI0013047847|nr:glycosyltransferase [Mangrovitalea sediminis]